MTLIVVFINLRSSKVSPYLRHLSGIYLQAGMLTIKELAFLVDILTLGREKRRDPSKTFHMSFILNVFYNTTTFSVIMAFSVELCWNVCMSIVRLIDL